MAGALQLEADGIEHPRRLCEGLLQLCRRRDDALPKRSDPAFLERLVQLALHLVRQRGERLPALEQPIDRGDLPLEPHNLLTRSSRDDGRLALEAGSTSQALAVDPAEELVRLARGPVGVEERCAQPGQRLLARAADARHQGPRPPGFLLEGRCPPAGTRQDPLQQAALGTLRLKRRKARRQARREKLEDLFGTREAGKAVGPQILELGFVCNEITRRRGYEDCPPWPAEQIRAARLTSRPR